MQPEYYRSKPGIHGKPMVVLLLESKPEEKSLRYQSYSSGNITCAKERFHREFETAGSVQEFVTAFIREQMLAKDPDGHKRLRVSELIPIIKEKRIPGIPVKKVNELAYFLRKAGCVLDGDGSSGRPFWVYC